VDRPRLKTVWCPIDGWHWWDGTDYIPEKQFHERFPMARLNFNADDFETPSRNLLEPGKYLAEIIESEIKATRSGGTMLSMTFEMLNPAKGRRVWHNYNLENKSEKAVEIGKQDLGYTAKAVGKPRFDDTEELHNIPLTITVIVEQGDGEYGPSNKIKAWGPESDFDRDQPTIGKRKFDKKETVVEEDVPW
jgi:hypothetical protein